MGAGARVGAGPTARVAETTTWASALLHRAWAVLRGAAKEKGVNTLLLPPSQLAATADGLHVGFWLRHCTVGATLANAGGPCESCFVPCLHIEAVRHLADGRLLFGPPRHVAVHFVTTALPAKLVTHLVLRAQCQLDAEAELYRLPRRDLLHSEKEVYARVQANLEVRKVS